LTAPFSSLALVFFIVLLLARGPSPGDRNDPSIRRPGFRNESLIIRDVGSGSVNGVSSRNHGNGEGRRRNERTSNPGAVGTGVSGESEKRVPRRIDAGVQINLPKPYRQVATSR
jgi:hypothetical protein